ncbi:MAG TPA: protein kinase [Bryobacteraceae bacterium]|nr:protein kinase [Bryobacteraceae bacterium]
MTAPDFQRVEEIFHAALECEPDQLDAFLNDRCGGDESLRREVEALLALHRQAGSFIEAPIADVAAGLLNKDEADLLIGRTIGHYKITQCIGAGGMGEVYLATDIIVGRKAALKFLHARFTGDAMRLKRFQQEARAVAGLNHPNILTVYEVGEDQSIQYIASELIEGETLRQRLTRGRIQLNEAVDIAVQVAGALAAAHSAGTVHRDVKPENIMLRPDGYVKVLDFGIAKLAEQELPATIAQDEALFLVETNLGSVLGTVHYMSPEQARAASVDKRSDIWSLGVVLYEMTVGHAPFSGDTSREVMTAILNTEPRPLTNYTADIPCALEPILSKALQKNPGQRYQNASEMLGELRGLRRKLEFAAEMAKSAPEKSIAVLPFENLSDDKANAYFADGIQEEILMRLSRIRDLKVISRTSTQRFRDTNEPVGEIAKKLGVATILEGSVRKAGDAVRVHVQLIDAISDLHIWAESYDRQLIDIFAVESDIAQNIANVLQAKLTRAERRAITSRPTKNLEAYQLCLKARHQWKNFYAPGYEKVLEYFEQAVALDPSYAVAQTGLSDYYAFGAANGLLPPDESWPRAEEGLRKSLALDDTLADSYHLLAAMELYYNRDWLAAERAFRHAAELDPNLADIPHHYALCLALFGRNEEALAQIERAALLDPFFPGLSLHRGTIFFFLRDYDSAIKRFAETLETYPDYAAAHEQFGDAYEKRGMLHEAITQWSTALTLRGKPEHARMLEKVFATSGFQAAVQALAQRQLEDLDRKRLRGEYVPSADYVFACVRRGDLDQAFAWLPKMVDERNWFALQLRVNPILDPLRGDPRFEKLANQTLPHDLKENL